jgi:hypothetical protein
MSNLGFKLWWARDTTTILTILLRCLVDVVVVTVGRRDVGCMLRGVSTLN